MTILKRWLSLGLLMILCTLPAGVWAEAGPKHGLMWNRTGLPLTFPLLVRTDPGRDYRLLLRDAETAAPALAAYIEGGRFFRVLAPPGRYAVQIAYGDVWEGEDALFGTGPDAGVIEVAEPLSFEVRSFSSKGGHMIDLRGLTSTEASLSIQGIRDCQGFGLALWPDETDARRAALPGPRPDARRKTGDDLLELLGPLEALRAKTELDVIYPPGVRPEDQRPRLMRYDVRPYGC